MVLNTVSETPVAGSATARILSGAAACFGRCGYRGASMSAIAREAGVAKSLLHYHFESKEQLFIDVQLGLFRGLLHRVRGLVGEGKGSVEHLWMSHKFCHLHFRFGGNYKGICKGDAKDFPEMPRQIQIICIV